MSRTAGPMPDTSHGTASGYNYWRCRCTACLAWSAERARRRRARRPRATRVLLADQHGTRSRYERRGCRCDPCTEASRAYHRAWWRARHGAPS